MLLGWKTLFGERYEDSESRCLRRKLCVYTRARTRVARGGASMRVYYTLTQNLACTRCACVRACVRGGARTQPVFRCVGRRRRACAEMHPCSFAIEELVLSAKQRERALWKAQLTGLPISRRGNIGRGERKKKSERRGGKERPTAWMAERRLLWNERGGGGGGRKTRGSNTGKVE